MGKSPPRRGQKDGSGPARVVFLLQDLLFGGTQRQALELAARLDPARFRVEVWMLMAGDDFVPWARERGLTLRWLSRRGFVGPGGLWGLWRALRSEKPDLLLLLTALPNIWGRILGRLAGAPVVLASCRGGGAPARQHERLLWRLADFHLSNSQAMKDRLVADCGLPESRVAVIRNGVDVERFRPADPATPDEFPDKPLVILCLARLAPDKDHDTLIRAFARIAPQYPGVELRLVGDGPRRAALAALVERLLPGRAGAGVRFIPGQAEVEVFLREADILVLSSVREALPNVVLEAMATGLPVVATRVGGLAELVEHEASGLLAPSGDDEALALALARLIDDAALRRAFGREGRRRAETLFSLSAMAEAHARLFSQLLEEEG